MYLGACCATAGGALGNQRCRPCRLTLPFLRRAPLLLDRAVRLLDEGCDRALCKFRIEANPHPAAHPDIRRDEEVLWIGGDEILLGAGRGGGPDGDTAVAMVVVGEHHEQPAVNAERWRAPGDLLLGVGKSEADVARQRECCVRVPG